MDYSTPEKVVIGRVEKIKFPTLDGIILHARIDTGAKSSSLWALSVQEVPSGLQVEFPMDNDATARIVHTFKDYEMVRVSSSMGQEQDRYKIKLSVIIKKRRILATFTLADRASLVYPVLIGRSTLMRKFIVDVARGNPLKERESSKTENLQAKVRSLE